MRKTKYTFDLLNPIVDSCLSIGCVLDSLGLKRTGGNYRNVVKWIRYNNIKTDHFKGMAWNKGERKETNPSLMNQSKKTRTPDEEIFIQNSSYSGGNKIIKRMMESFRKEYKCDICGLSKWLGDPITLHLDHINGMHNDNRFENLRILCPNCHQQTLTWGSKNRIKNAAVSELADDPGLDPGAANHSVEVQVLSAAPISKKQRHCEKCGDVIFNRKAKRFCSQKCSSLSQRVVKRPTLEELKNDITNMPLLKVGAKYGVSDNAIRKWLSSYSLT